MENYFNYFTEIEEFYQRSRGTPTLLSTLDWALIEAWKEAGIPLEAVCAGIQRTFEKYARRPRRLTKINGLAYCTQAVMTAAEAAKEDGAEAGKRGKNQELAPPPFPPEELARFLASCAAALEAAAGRARLTGVVLAEDLAQSAAAIRQISARRPEELLSALQDLEQSLTGVEDKVTASLTRGSPAELLSRIHQEVDRGIAPYRRTMNAAQIDLLHRQFLKKRLFEHYQVPRLSLFYL
ncbi:MAG: hypothetical protein ACRD3O_12305 [Terriglobia bacterium]